MSLQGSPTEITDISDICNPLSRMEIRFDGLNNIGGLRTLNGARFGWVRNGGTKPHQGVDLYARSGTPIVAIATGHIVRIRHHDMNFGQEVMLRFIPNRHWASVFGVSFGTPLFALYAHLSRITAKMGKVQKGVQLGATGTSGNADQRYPHLHFEIRTMKDPGGQLHHRLNPERAFLIDYSRPIEIMERMNSTA